MSTQTTKPILISGAGICSLLFAQGLLRAKIPFLIFEQDASLTFRAQGYRLRLSAEGLDAIEAVLGPQGFADFWEKCSKTGGGGFASLDALTGETVEPPKIYQDKDKPGAEQGKNNMTESLTSRDGKIVGISRGEMRKTFIAGCEPYIHWSHRVTGYERTASGVHAVFADGSRSVEGEMLVGGEGIHSKVAKQLSGGKLKVYDTGARGIHGQAPTTAFKDLGEGVWRIADDSNPNGRVFVITNVRPGDMDDPDVYFGWTMGGTPGVVQAPGGNFSVIGEPAARIAKELSAKWHPRFKPLFEQMAEGEAAFWKITCSTPSGVPEWDNDPRVTVIGDAVHSMTPAAGIGANTAVRDSALLSRLLSEAWGGNVDGVTAEYETKMRVYASEAVRISYGAATAQFSIKIDEGSSPMV